MPLSEAEQPLNRMVPLPLTTMPGRTFPYIYIHIIQSIKEYNFKINAWPRFNWEEKEMMEQGGIDNFFNYFAWLPRKN